MDIKMADGRVVTTDQLWKDVEASKKQWLDRDLCFSYVTVEALLEKLKELDPEKQFTVYWFGGDRQVIKGSDFATACNNAGIDAGAFGAMDFYDFGDSRTHEWNTEQKAWVPAADVTPPVKKQSKLKGAKNVR